MLNLVELNAILYYADYLSLTDSSTTVTDNCKYYFIFGSPMNSAYIVDCQPFYDLQNKYYKQAESEYIRIKNKYGVEGISSFLNGICNLAAIGCVNANQMLKCIHLYSSKYERNYAFKKYKKWISNQIYTHLEVNEKGDAQRVECTRYVAHAEIGTKTNPLVSYTNKPAQE